MLGAREEIEPHLGRDGQVLRACGIAGIERHHGLPVFAVGIAHRDLGAGLRLAAALELSAGDARDRVGTHVPGLRRFLAGILRFGVLRSG